MPTEILKFARGKILTQTMGTRPAHLFDETFRMEVSATTLAEYPRLGQICSRRHQMPGFTKRFQAAVAP